MAVNGYDVCVVGSGVAGAFVALRIAKEHKDCKVILFDTGERPSKRRHSVYGFLGVLPTGDGKIYLSDLNKVVNLVGQRKANAAFKWFSNYSDDIFDMKVIKDNGPKTNLEKRIKKSGFDIQKNNYIQLYPKDIHNISKRIASDIDNNIETSFNDSVIEVKKHKRLFHVKSNNREITCSKLIICAGRGGWRWTRDLYNSFDIISDNNTAKYGIKIEANANLFKEWNKSTCSLLSENIEVGPFSWYGTVMPEDHIDLAITSFRSNETRWETREVSFNLIGNIEFPNNGFEQTNRIGQLTFILSNDRIAKERLTNILLNKSRVSIMPEYNWLPEKIEKLKEFMPDIVNRGYFYVPTILPLAPNVKISNSMQLDVSNMFVAGEASGQTGILTAILTGIIAADSACK